LSFVADDEDCQTEEDTFTNAGVEEAASPEPIMDAYTRRAAAVTTPARFQQSPSKELLFLVFFSLRESNQLHRRHTEEIQRRNTPNRNKNTSDTILVMSVPLQNTLKSDTDGEQSVHE
jgi:hypothetical protein